MAFFRPTYGKLWGYCNMRVPFDLKKCLCLCCLGRVASRTLDPKLKFRAPAPLRFGPLKTKTIELFVQLACSTKYVSRTGTQISGSGSTVQIFLVLDPQSWLLVTAQCMC